MKSALIISLAGLLVKTVVGDILSPPGFGALESVAQNVTKELMASQKRGLSTDTNKHTETTQPSETTQPTDTNKPTETTQPTEKKDDDKMKSTFVDVPEHILKETNGKDSGNLRGDSTFASEVGDAEDKRNPVLESIEGAEKKLVEALGAVKSKLATTGKDQKPIKVDCGTTRVRVVCNKKGQPETVDDLPDEKANKAISLEIPESVEPLGDEDLEVKDTTEPEEP